jgi:glycosyltransferase involved in cell wall biosynthesis
MTSELNINHQPICILFTHYGDNWIRGSERCLLDLLNNLDKKKFTAILWCNQQIMEVEAKKLGIKVYRSDFSLLLGWNAPRFNIASFIGLIKQALTLIDRHQIKLIHANSAAPCQWLNFTARQRNLPLICHLHSIYQLRDRLTLGLYQVSMAVGVSQYVLGDLHKDNMPRSRTCVIANGIDKHELQAQKTMQISDKLSIDVGDFVIATVGSLIYRKGIDLIIAAVAQLIKNKLPIHLLIIGDGSEKNNLEKQIHQFGLSKNITLLGEQENAFAILRDSAHLFVSAAREEAFGLVLAEASLAGLPVVAPAVGGIPDVVINGQTGVLIESEDNHALVKAITDLYLNPSLCHAMGKAGYQHILEKFTIDSNCQHFEHLYQKMLIRPTKVTPWHKDWSFNLSLQSAYKRLIKRGFVNEA